MPYYSVNPIMLAAAVIPAAFLMLKVYKADRLEKEPPALLFRLVILGIISTMFAVVLENIGQLLISGLDPSSMTYNLILYFVVVGFSEELGKYLVLKRATWRHPAFNCEFDAIVYSVFVSLGFALWENIQYVAMYGLEVALIRAVTAIPGHCSFAVFMGVWYGIAKKNYNSGKFANAKFSLRLSVIVPAIIHGAYDFIATLNDGSAFVMFIAFIIIVFMWAYHLVKKISETDGFIDFFM